MPSTTDCSTACCVTPSPINTPGTPGSNAFTVSTAEFILPAVGATAILLVADTSWVGNFQPIFISQGFGHAMVQVSGINSSTSVSVKNLGYEGMAAPGTVFAIGTTVSPGGTQPADLVLTTTELKALNATLLAGINAITDNSTGTASDTIAAGVGVQTLLVFVNLSQITATTIFNITPGYAFKVLAIAFSVEIAVTTAAKLATITPAVNGSGVTGGALSLTSANCTPKGAVVSGSAITAGNTGTSAQTLTLVASTVTAFSEGTGWIMLKVQNTDSANAVASLADHINDIRSQLQA